jgi:hypothetical protein
MAHSNEEGGSGFASDVTSETYDSGNERQDEFDLDADAEDYSYGEGTDADDDDIATVTFDWDVLVSY